MQNKEQTLPRQGLSGIFHYEWKWLGQTCILRTWGEKKSHWSISTNFGKVLYSHGPCRMDLVCFNISYFWPDQHLSIRHLVQALTQHFQKESLSPHDESVLLCYSHDVYICDFWGFHIFTNIRRIAMITFRCFQLNCYDLSALKAFL